MEITKDYFFYNLKFNNMKKTKLRSLKTNFEQINKGNLKRIKGGDCSSVCDGTIVTSCCYHYTPPGIVTKP
jgi:hypothetical protein